MARADFHALPPVAQRAALAVLLDAAHDMRSDGDPATVEALEALAAMAAPSPVAATAPPSPPPGFTGIRSRVLAAAVDGPHHVTLAVYRFPPGDGDPPGCPIDVPYVELHETHDGARPGRVMALSALVHLCQNASDDEVWQIGGREAPGGPGADEVAGLRGALAEARATIARLNRRAQAAEATPALPVKTRSRRQRDRHDEARAALVIAQRAILDETSELAADIRDQVGGWALPTGQSAVVLAPGGHLSIVHTAALERWAGYVERLRDALTGGSERATLPAMASPHSPPPTKSLPSLLAEIETAAQEAMRLHPHALHLRSVLALCNVTRRENACEEPEPKPREDRR